MSEVRCPDCGQTFEVGEPVRVCDGCQAAHHQEGRSPTCWESEPRGCKFCGGRQGRTVPFGKERKASEHGIRVCPFRTWIPGAPEEGQPCLGFRCVLFRSDVNPPACTLGMAVAGDGGAVTPRIGGLEQKPGDRDICILGPNPSAFPIDSARS